MDFKVVSPANRSELLQTIVGLQSEKFRFGAGYTDLLLELRSAPVPGMTVVNLARLDDDEFTAVGMVGNRLRIGSLVAVAEVERDKAVEIQYPALHQAAGVLASRQIREVATIGGNICTASPAGDVACALAALKATCEILRADGMERSIPISDFLTGVRSTAMKSDEVLKSVTIPANKPGAKLHSGFIKVGTRRAMECAVVSLAWHLQISADGVVTAASAAIGSAAPTIRFTTAACDYLAGKPVDTFDSEAAGAFADLVLSVASPISDKRGSADYRRRVLHNFSKCVLESIQNIPEVVRESNTRS